MAGYGVGASLVSAGQQQKSEAMKVLGAAADQEAKRNADNKLLEAQEKQGKKTLGATLGGAAGFYLGASYGSAGGPIGALIGGAVGAIAGGLF